jgi:hypothetical protein
MRSGLQGWLQAIMLVGAFLKPSLCVAVGAYAFGQNPDGGWGGGGAYNYQTQAAINYLYQTQAAINYWRRKYCRDTEDKLAADEETQVGDNCYQYSSLFRGERVYWGACLE